MAILNITESTRTLGIGLGLVIVAVLALATAIKSITSESEHTPVICEFKNMTRVYRTTQAEANRDSLLITVYQGDRIFMLRRSSVTACYNLDKEDNETP